ncbi:uncharacterized protein LOC128951749 [Oppia nitens]|uniref:uncharacterized protein LOC128951749 n=1 Tax=Oppia nitens TaxID=1686743 RepID=UPI0023DCD611|nr:uncharacterized protein LOC128951749 [Oppia nitens]
MPKANKSKTNLDDDNNTKDGGHHSGGGGGDGSKPRENLSVNQRILQELHSLYANKDSGLISIGQRLGLHLLAPRRKIIVLLIGNHSAGKSSFINWYIKDNVQKTGVAIETQGFTFVTSGKRRESLTGKATIHLYPHFKTLEKIPGVIQYLSTEISASAANKFNLVTFIDTPGLVDGDVHYPYDVDKAIAWLGDLADLIFVFFDPIGQALCKRTLNLVEKLNARHTDRMRFYLSKADEAGHESDRQKVLMQIVQELCKRPGLNKAGFEMPTIYVPVDGKPDSKCVNQIQEVCQDIEKTINYTIQNTLNTLEKDCEQLVQLIDSKLDDDNRRRGNNFKATLRRSALGLFAGILPLILILNLFESGLTNSVMKPLLGTDLTNTIASYISPITSLSSIVPKEYHFHALVLILGLVVIFVLLAKWFARFSPTLPRKDRKYLIEKQDLVQNKILNRRQSLYKEYLFQSVGEHELMT